MQQSGEDSVLSEQNTRVCLSLVCGMCTYICVSNVCIYVCSMYVVCKCVTL